LGDGHNGPDIVENVMCVCPNHHVLLDYAAIPINPKKLIAVHGHTLSKIYIEYHNEIYERERATAMAE
jgi:predicted restriction endonuclease